MADLDIGALLRKLSKVKGMDELIENAVLLYILMTDEEVSAWAKAIAIGALIYLVDPIDAIPDAIPFVGLTDDLAVIVAALKALTSQITNHHRAKAREFTKNL